MPVTYCIKAEQWILSNPAVLLLIKSCTFISLFLLAGLVSFVIQGIDREKLGQLIVLFIQPIGTFFIAYYINKKYPKAQVIFLYAVYIFVAVCGVVAITQYFSLFTLPQAYWGNSEEPKRAVGLFTHPDMFGLFLAPLLAWLIPNALGRLENIRNNRNLLVIITFLLGGKTRPSSPR